MFSPLLLCGHPALHLSSCCDPIWSLSSKVWVRCVLPSFKGFADHLADQLDPLPSG